MSQYVFGQVVEATTQTPLPAATIVPSDANGTPLQPIDGTTSDLSGNFQFSVRGDARYLSVRYVGYTTTIVPIAASPLHVELDIQSNILDEIVVRPPVDEAPVLQAATPARVSPVLLGIAGLSAIVLIILILKR